MIRTTAIALVLAAGLPAQADEVSDAIQSALDAYTAGDMQFAAEELAYAQQLLQEMSAMSLSDCLPDAPDGWTREINTEMNAGLAMMGGGVGAEAEYSDGTNSFTVTAMADNPMVTAMAGMLSNAAIMATMGKMTRVGRQKYVTQNGEMSTMVNNRVLVQAKGAAPEVMVQVLELIDYRKLGAFGS
ncbi:MAG: hypothetical protein QNJ16_07170 [Rhodobacter sp.]|nr:hypothetical protein [Rhodobacter sp.]